MKINFCKQVGGVLIPANDSESERMKRFANGEIYEVDIKQARNNKFHSKVFAFMNFVFEHWRNGHEFKNEQAQFDDFRGQLSILAGYCEQVYTLDGSGFKVIPKSWSYAKMSQEEFEQLYSSLINVAMQHVFNDCNDENIYNELINFF